VPRRGRRGTGTSGARGRRARGIRCLCALRPGAVVALAAVARRFHHPAAGPAASVAARRTGCVGRGTGDLCIALATIGQRCASGAGAGGAFRRGRCRSRVDAGLVHNLAAYLDADILAAQPADWLIALDPDGWLADAVRYHAEPLARGRAAHPWCALSSWRINWFPALMRSTVWTCARRLPPSSWGRVKLPSC